MIEIKNMKSVEDCERYLEGCLNDFESGISTKKETMSHLIEYTIRVVEIVKDKIQKNNQKFLENIHQTKNYDKH